VGVINFMNAALGARFLAGAFLAAAFFAGADFATGFFGAAFFAGAFFAGAFFAGAFLAGAFFAVAMVRFSIWSKNIEPGCARAVFARMVGTTTERAHVNASPRA
jgi:hypothetical protein